MSEDCLYGFGCRVASDFPTTVAAVTRLLEERGFKIHTRLDLDEVLDRPQRVTHGSYVILGACRAEHARQLFKADLKIGLLMPCNIIVYEIAEGGCRVMIKDPLVIMDLFKDPVILEATIKLKAQLEEIVDQLAACA